MADFVICPRCRRQNPADAVFCNRCGVRLLTEGVYFRNREPSSSVGLPQMLLGLAVLILAGLVLGGGAIFLLGNTRPRATPTDISAGATGTPLTTGSGATPSAGLTLPPTPTLIATATPFLPTPSPSPPPTPTPEPTPEPTPVDCALASQGTNVKHFQLGLGHAASKVLPKTWCIRHVTIDQWVQFGTARLLDKKKIVFQHKCEPPGPCSPAEWDYVPPYQANQGRTLSYEFDCIDDPATGTPELPVNECADATKEGAVITVDYEPFAAP